MQIYLFLLVLVSNLNKINGQLYFVGKCADFRFEVPELPSGKK